jgi:hypothetical protein
MMSFKNQAQHSTISKVNLKNPDQPLNIVDHGERVRIPLSFQSHDVCYFPRQRLISPSWSIFIGLAFVIIASSLAWVFAPKGENQT